MDKADLPIATPCDLDWRKMTPAEGGRFCGECKKVVRDLSTLSEREARALLREAGGGGLCVRYVYDRRGRIFFAGDQPLPAAMLSRAKRAAAVLAAPLALAACSAGDGQSLPPAPGHASHTIKDPQHPDEDMNLDPRYPYGESMGGAPAWEPQDIPGLPDAGPDQDAGEVDAAPAEDGGAAPETGPTPHI